MCNTMHALKIEQQKAKTVMQKELDTNATMRRKALNELQKEYNGTNHRLD